jgi:hypothetical protein
VFSKKISAGFFGGFCQRSRFFHFGSVVGCCYQACYEGFKFGVANKPSRNFFNSAASQQLAAASLTKMPVLVWSFAKTSET